MTLDQPEAEAKLRDVLKEARRTAGLSQTQFGQRIGVTQQLVSKYETGERRISAVDLVVISRALGLNPGELLETIEESLA